MPEPAPLEKTILKILASRICTCTLP
jgi:hypothetical protein